MIEKVLLIEFLKNDFTNINKLYEDNWFELIKLSKKQNVSNILFYNLKKNGYESLIPKKYYEILKNDYQKTIFRNMKIKSEIIKINNELKKNNIRALFLKGSYLINHIYENLSLRYMQDIDLLVEKNNSEKTFELVKNLLYIPQNDLDEYDYNFSFLHHLPKMNKNDVFLEIHSNIINNKGFDINNIWKNSIEINNISYLDEIDLIIHLCIHISYQDLFCIDLRHYYDIFYILKNKNIDLEKLLLRINEYGFEKGVFFVLNVIEKLFLIKIGLPSKNYVNEIDIQKAINLMWLYDKTNLKEYLEYKTSPNIYKEFKNQNLFSKFKIFLEKVFIPKSILKHKYRIKNKKIIYFYYLVRIIDLIKNHSKSINSKYYQNKLDLFLKINEE